MRWDEELPFFVSEQTGFEEAYIREVIKCCLVIGLFSKEFYDSEKILTSKEYKKGTRRYAIYVEEIMKFTNITSFLPKI